MINQWKKEGKLFIKETESEFLVISCLTFVGAENNSFVYGPTLHRINKINYPIKSINEIAQLMFEDKSKNMSLAEKIVYISAFMETCEDINDNNGERIWFSFDNGKEASEVELEEKLLSMIKEFNL